MSVALVFPAVVAAPLDLSGAVGSPDHYPAFPNEANAVLYIHDAPPGTVSEIWCESNGKAGRQATQTEYDPPNGTLRPPDTRLHPSPSGTEPSKCLTRFRP
ncbi:MAG TPA: hypothetical protein VI997_05335 [Candidatus Thermoplasmatota archaeon]|nr:hypothetical protein [Candidatus Thermoplasmatota archaeon]